MSTNLALDRAKRWLFGSGIFIADRTDREFGAVYSYFDAGARRYELVYAEATGYFISLVKYLNSLREDPGLMELAEAAGDWLVAEMKRFGGPIAIGRRGGDDIRESYPFDNGICCRGLIDLYDLTGQKEYLESAETVAEWIVREALTHDGSLRPVFDLGTGKFTEDRRLWFKVSGSFHAKIAMPLLRLHAITGREVFRDAALRICGWALSEQRPDGSFPVNTRSRLVSLHTHCYTIEALLYAYAMEKSDGLLRGASRGVDWLRRVQAADGSSWLWHGRSLSNLKASYAAAQAVRVFVLMYMLENDKGLMDAADQAAAFALSMQGDGDDRIAGGFLEGDVRRYGIRIRRSTYVLSWGTMFAIQALHLLRDSREKDFNRCVMSVF